MLLSNAFIADELNRIRSARGPHFQAGIHRRGVLHVAHVSVAVDAFPGERIVCLDDVDGPWTAAHVQFALAQPTDRIVEFAG